MSETVCQISLMLHERGQGLLIDMGSSVHKVLLSRSIGVGCSSGRIGVLVDCMEAP